MASRQALHAAFVIHRKEWRDQLDTLTAKRVRRALELELGLPERALDGQKDMVDELISQELMGVASQQPQQPEEQLEDELEQSPVKGTAPRKKDAGGSRKRKERSHADGGKRGKAGGVECRTKHGRPRKHANGSPGTPSGDENAGDGQQVADKMPASKGGKRVAASGAGGAGPRQFSARVLRLRDMCKDATITVGPAVYRAKDDSGVAAALEALLGRHGLSAGSDAGAVRAVRAKLALQRELDGIDTSNIVDDGGRRPRRAAAAAAARVAQAVASSGSRSRSDSGSQGGGDGGDVEPASGKQNSSTSSQGEEEALAGSGGLEDSDADFGGSGPDKAANQAGQKQRVKHVLSSDEGSGASVSAPNSGGSGSDDEST